MAENNNRKFLKLSHIEEAMFTNLMNTPYSYQIEAYQQLKNKHRTVLQLPCGMGKTLISMMIAQSYNQIIIVSPLKEYCKQNLERYRNEQSFASYASLLIDSDGTRCVSEIREFIQQHEKHIISVTYKSMDMINEIMEDLDCSQLIAIVDEFHNLSQKDVIGDEILVTPMHTFLTNRNLKILFMSATPRIFEREDETTENSLDSEIFGNVDYSYSMGDAIRHGLICDYQLYVPNVSLNNNNTETMDERLSKATFLVKGCIQTGSKKCIVYHRTQHEAEEFMNCLITIHEFYSIKLYATTMLSNDGPLSRRNKLDYFTQFDGYAFLSSVEILNECIDIPSCDSIYMLHPSESKIRNIQRLNRATRKDKNNSSKIANIFLWADEYDDIVNMISHLKEYDDSFTIQKITLSNKNNTYYKLVETQKDGNQMYDDIEQQKLIDMVIGVKKIKSWEKRYEELQLFIETHDRYPHQKSKQMDEYSLGQFVHNQRKNYTHGKLSSERVQKLEELKEWIWFEDNEEHWLVKYKELQMFIETNGNYPHNSQNPLKPAHEKRLSRFMLDQRSHYKEGKLNSERVQKLEELNGWKWFEDKEELWLQKYKELQIFIETNLRYPLTKHENEKILGHFIADQRHYYKKGKISIERIQKLEELNGWKWVGHYPEWNRHLCEINSAEHVQKVEELKDCDMSSEHVKKSVGCYLDHCWLQTYKELQTFIESNFRYPFIKHENEKRLGKFVANQRFYYKNKKINSERIQKLEELKDWKWNERKNM